MTGQIGRCHDWEYTFGLRLVSAMEGTSGFTDANGHAHHCMGSTVTGTSTRASENSSSDSVATDPDLDYYGSAASFVETAREIMLGELARLVLANPGESEAGLRLSMSFYDDGNDGHLKNWDLTAYTLAVIPSSLAALAAAYPNSIQLPPVLP